MKKIKKNIFSVIAVLALSATAIGGMSACGDKSIKPVDSNVGNTVKISTALGEVTSRVSGRTLYVAPDGKRADATGTEEDPYDISYLLNNSLELLRPGDTVLVAPGIYKWQQNWGSAVANGDGIIMSASGAYNNYITIKNSSTTGEKAVLDFSDMRFDGSNRGVQIWGNYVYWYGIDICGAGDNGLFIAGSYNTVEYSEFYNNRDSGLQLGRSASSLSQIKDWPNYNLVKNCTSHNNYDNETYGENADGFAAKLTVGYGNVFDGCIAYRNSDDGWDLYAKTDSGNIGQVIMYNCIAFENGYLEYDQQTCNRMYSKWNGEFSEAGKNYTKEDPEFYGKLSYDTRDGDGNGFKLGGSVMTGDVLMYNCLSFNNKMHGVTDNSNPGVLSVNKTTSYDNGRAVIDDPTSPYFGQIANASWTDDASKMCGNINVMRWDYSYNNLSDVLSVAGPMSKDLAEDEYRGSVTNSILGIKKNYKIEGSIDADSKNGEKGVQFNAPAASDIFKKLPVTSQTTGEGAEAVTTYNYLFSGLKDMGDKYTGGATESADRVHLSWRNDDGSVNIGDLFYIENYEGLLPDVGSVLNKTSYDQYSHFYKGNQLVIDQNSKDITDAILNVTKETLKLNCNPDAVFQDFDVPVELRETCTVEWESGDTNWVKIGTEVKESISGSKYITLEVIRPSVAQGDKKVTLSAKLTYRTLQYNEEGEFTGYQEQGETTTSFEITIKAGDPKVGEVFVQDKNGTIVKNGESLIVDQYAVYYEPDVKVENGLDYNGKLLTDDQFTVSSKYMYAPDKNSPSTEVKYFTTSNAGVYTVTKTATLKADETKKGSVTYSIFVTSATAKVDFVKNESDVSTQSLAVNRDGYTISGELTNVTGVIYAVSSATPLEVNTSNIKTIEGVESFTFKNDTISVQFSNTNNAAYYVYYALSNMYGEITSEIYTAEVKPVNISTTEEFYKLARGEKIGDEEPVQTIYTLTCDLDFTGFSWEAKAGKAFRGLFNGLGHTISNITVPAGKDSGASSIFYKAENATIENVKFNNINITSSTERAGIVGTATGGYYYNIALTNININSSTNRVAALIAHVGGSNGKFNETTPLYISQVSVVNDADYVVNTSGTRAAGIIGYVQYFYNAIEINNCYVDSAISSGSEAGGIIASWEDREQDSLVIDRCYVRGTLSVGSSQRAGGILGYHKQGSVGFRVTNCASLVDIFVSGNQIFASLKNSSPIIGNRSASTIETVSNCISYMQEYATDFDVTPYSAVEMSSIDRFNSNGLNFDTDLWNFEFKEGSETELEGKLLTLKFLGNWA